MKYVGSKMENIVIKIVAKLATNQIFLDKIQLFAGLLETGASQTLILRREVRNSTINYEDSIKQLLEEWVSREGSITVGDLVKVLKRMECLDLAETLGKEYLSTTLLRSQNLPAKKNFVAWNVISPVGTFIGRTEEMEELDSFLNHATQRLIVISGMGGQGKTQLCHKWVQGLRKMENPPKIIWLQGENSTVLFSSIVGFAKEFIPGFDEAKEKTLEEITNKIAAFGQDWEKVVWIIDNVDKEYEEIKAFSLLLFHKMESSKIIITSRLKTVLSSVAEYLFLETIPPQDAHRLVKENVKGSLEDDVETLCQEMGYHALALQLSIGFIRSKQTKSIRKTGFGIPEFLKLFKDDKLPILHETEELSGYTKPILHHVKIFMEMLKENNQTTAPKIMHILSLVRSNGVEFDFLLHLVSATLLEFKCKNTIQAEAELEEELEILHSISLISCDWPIITIHPLIQEVTRKLFLDWTIVGPIILRNLDVANLPNSSLQHILRVWEIIGKNDFLLGMHAEVVSNIYEGLVRNSQVHSLLPLTEAHRKNLRRLFGNVVNGEVIRSEYMYAQAQMETGEYKEPLASFQSLKKVAAKLLGECALTFSIEASEASALNMMGKFAEAVQMFECLLPRYISVYTETGSGTMALRKEFALALSQCNKTAEALEQYQIVLKYLMGQLQFGPVHEKVLLTRGSIATCHYELGEEERAVAELKSILKIKEEKFGERHHSTLATRGNLIAMTFKNDFEKAKKEYKSLLDIEIDVLGPNHPHTFAHRTQYAICLLTTDEVERGKEELKRLLETEIRTRGEDYPYYNTARKLLSQLEGSNSGGKAK